MGQNFFEALLPVLTESLTERISLEEHICQEDAIERLQASALYPVLEDEFSKVWYYSVSKLYTLFKADAAF